MKSEALFAYFPKMTVKRFREGVAAFGSPDAFFFASNQEIKKQLPWDENFIDQFVAWREDLDINRIKKILAQEKISILTQDDDAYPPLLKQIYDPPFCLFIRGTLDLRNQYPIAVVGTRKCSNYGTQITHEIVTGLAQHGLTIVSGLALGIDGIAHEATLKAGGTTIAVLGSGINRHHIYPAVHKQLAERIIEKNGAVISEYPPGSLPSKFTFPRRNRIIAGITLGTLVIEAADKSGALITSSYALEHGREIFAVPHPITSPTGTGPNKLLKEGAQMVTSASDIIDVLNLNELKTFTQNASIIPDSREEAAILEHLSREPIHVDVLTKNSGLTSREVNSTLTLMEMKGKVRNIGNMHYVVAR
ncbi:MAG: DNA-protecting protein DprA [Candidatus Magasanikbacteria bacterium CG_4_9_14_0_2_um_filter_41_10]|uniref:DNA-protecting protein DprA n=1 Tax=Candidatus Magasanikbacteria bacterium CG_4_10_14_0_2_um_filter_41_31 TaxID=1974639 RepID=A0A2M7V4R0_9BACT|nr:MAG: DNA protecting protein DprA [Candidatus Magasanikbacteria bacterium CG1_02_41_34]PIZ93543.1 MAG: DNA-protecting protein DprA [Candidatus Magasanikbacteria bacterium CG_4_10_14_0_2_um_filter_41_31]PJC53329.1 MAG: DNA-protecting protein DprA [Candidatus Magasanikbacteria bacterium CG_4_9_14_0_2_um_filter_41_10]